MKLAARPRSSGCGPWTVSKVPRSDSPLPGNGAAPEFHCIP